MTVKEAIEELKKYPPETEVAVLVIDLMHWSHCAVNNAPALPVGPCDCGGFKP